jgi:hypothetical protein
MELDFSNFIFIFVKKLDSMKESTIKRVNKTIVCYLSIVGLYEGKYINQDNPIVTYFMSNILTKLPQIIGHKEFSITDIDMDEIDEYLSTTDISLSVFHTMIIEMNRMYNKLNDTKNIENEEVKEVLINFIGSESDYTTYINVLIDQFKLSFYELLRYYNSDVPSYNEIKINILTDRMNYCAEIENYEEAAGIRDKIKETKDRI